MIPYSVYISQFWWLSPFSVPTMSGPIWFSFLLIPLSVGMFPHVFQHWLTARSATTFKLPIVVHPIFIMIVWVPCVLLGAWASAPASGIPHGPDFSENAVLAVLVQKHAGPVLGGLLTAGILAAIMSSLDSQFLCIGTMFTEDIVVHYGGKKRFNERTVVLMARLFVAAIVTLTFILSLVLPRAVFTLGIWSFSGFTGLFPLVFAAIYWRRLTAPGALACVLVTVATWSVLFWRSGFGANKKYAFPEQPMDVGFLTIPPMLPVVTIFVSASLALVVVSLLTDPPGETTINRFFGKKASR